jgi:hypothetical protein
MITIMHGSKTKDSLFKAERETALGLLYYSNCLSRQAYPSIIVVLGLIKQVYNIIRKQE